MAPKNLKRKLAAILSADVKGYSRLMGDDEEATVATLTAYRQVLAEEIGKHRGRVVDSPGDNLLAEFASVVDAVQGAVAIQRRLATENAELSKHRKMEFRIGVNLGDVIEEEERLYGDGVNIAARLEALADGGGICISGTVHEHVFNKLDLAYEYLGEQAVKNIARPVKVYKVQMDSEDGGGTVDADASAPSDKPSIAVLPFVNMSGDPEQEYFSDGITEDLITDLSKISGLFVIARNSVFLYKGKAVKPEVVSRELGVRHILEGSVRKAGRRVRITAQLVDAATAGHVWAERYDRDLDDIFALQDEVTQEIVEALKVRLTAGEQERLQQPRTHDVEAYEYYLRGREHHAHRTRAANAEAQQMFGRAIELDAEFAAAYAWLGRTYVTAWLAQWNEDPRTLESALSLAQQAVALDEALPTAHETLGYIHLANKQYEEAIAEGERAIALDPNDADAAVSLAEILICAAAERAAEAAALVEGAMHRNPHYPATYLFVLGGAYLLLERHDEAIGLFKRLLARNPDHLSAHFSLGLIYDELGLEAEFQEEMVACRKLMAPQASLADLLPRFPFKDQARLDRVAAILRKAGMR